MLSNLEIIEFKKFLRLQIGLGLRPRPILAVLGINFIQLFPNWTACSPITYTKGTPLNQSTFSNFIMVIINLNNLFLSHRNH